MEIILRDYVKEDFSRVIPVFRESYENLRQSRGGSHPDDAIDFLLQGSDKKLFAIFAGRASLIVAQVKETGEVIGTGGIATGPIGRIFGSTFSMAHYVKPSFQRGRAGVNVGSMLRLATLERAKKRGCRKLYGFSTPEAVNFHKKFGAKFYPQHDTYYARNLVRVHYYEIELKPSFWNRFKIEPLLYKSGQNISLIRAFLRVLGPIGSLRVFVAYVSAVLSLKPKERHTLEA
jgi:hypothetical protein